MQTNMKERQSQTVWNEIAYFLSRHQRHIDRHIFEKDAVARRRIVDEDMRDHTPLRFVASLLRNRCAPTTLPF